MSSIVNFAAGKIGELLVREAKLLYGVKDQFKSLQEELTMMSSFLIDMEATVINEEVGNERSHTTFKQIRKIARDAEDLIESYILQAGSSADTKKQVLTRYLCFCSPLVRTYRVGSEIRAIKARIAETMDRCRKFEGEDGVRTDPRRRQQPRPRRIRPIAYSHTYEDHVVGLDEDIEKLVTVLTSEEGSETRVVSIEGMGGSGKTTLARKLFNHDSVKKYFDCVAWVSVSQQWVSQQILMGIWKKVGGATATMDESESPNGFQVLVEGLHGYLERKKYLVVLDDVWEDKALEDILPAFPLQSVGTKIIVTTRNKKVVDYPDLRPLTYSHEPRRLTDDESWELFGKIAHIRREEEPSDSAGIARLEALGKEMLRKCKGLPLAVIALAGILSEKENVDEWEKVSKAVSSRIMEDGRGTHLYGPVNQMLALSYNDLAPELKACFLYLARFPEDTRIFAGVLTKMWIAEGFLTTAKQHEGDTIEDVARQYLDELVQRCLVQVATRGYEGKVKTIQIHDVVRDLCVKKAQEEEFLETFTSKCPSSEARVTESCRVAILSPKGVHIPFPTKSQHLRSLEYVVHNFDERNIRILHPIFKNFKLLRVLLLEGVHTFEGLLTDELGSLIHLRYFGLKCTNIKQLPFSIGKLRNLLTLECSNASYELALKVPDVLWKIEGLRHLYLQDHETTNRKALRLDTLKCLHTLKGLNGGSWMVKELPTLAPTLRKLDIKDIKTRDQLVAAVQCPSAREDNLHSLALEWGHMHRQTVKLSDILEPINHCQRLRKLVLVGTTGPDGLSSVQFPSGVRMLELNGILLEAEATLVGLGKLPQLSVLKLRGVEYAGAKWTCNADDFPQLKQLFIDHLGSLEQWIIETGAMPQLRNLVIRSCPELRKLPVRLKSITTLQQFEAFDMGVELKRRLTQGGEDAHIIEHVPLVKIY